MTIDIVERIKTHLSNPRLDENGEPYGMKLLPPTFRYCHPGSGITVQWRVDQ